MIVVVSHSKCFFLFPVSFFQLHRHVRTVERMLVYQGLMDIFADARLAIWVRYVKLVSIQTCCVCMIKNLHAAKGVRQRNFVVMQ